MSHKKKTFRKKKTSNSDEEREMQRKPLTLGADSTKLSFFDEIEDEVRTLKAGFSV